MLKKTMKIFLIFPLLLAAVLWLGQPVCAEEIPMAKEISGRSLVESHSGISAIHSLFDGLTKELVNFRNGTQITLAHEEGIGSLYLVFDKEYGEYTVTDPDTGESHTWGNKNMLHEFLDLEAAFGRAPTRATISFENGDGILNEMYVFTAGQTPDFVQKWEQPKDGETDIVLFSTHGDDEQLFFAGLLPYYAIERGYQVQVAYMTGHRNLGVRRAHEMLDGLWAVGIRTYPVFGEFGDYSTQSAQETYQKYLSKGITEEDILSYVVEQIRRFRPKVAVGHDLEGEYGHGMHMAYAEQLCKAAEAAADASQFPETAEQYGVWDVPKTYLHLYPENPIIMDWDQPLESLGGMTPYEVTKKLGFPAHASQQIFYSWYFDGKDTAAEITQYSPCEFGLYRSTVGEDVQKNDFFENVTSHAQDVELEQQRIAEEARRQEEERLAAVKAEQEKAEQEKAQQEAAALETMPKAEEKTPVKKTVSREIWIAMAAIGGLLVFAVIAALISRSQKRW